MPETETAPSAPAPGAALSAQSKPLREAGVLSYRALEDMVIYDPAESRAASLNPSARAIWELCDGERTVGQICQSLSDTHDVPREQLEADVLSVIDQLCSLRLLRR